MNCPKCNRELRQREQTYGEDATHWVTGETYNDATRRMYGCPWCGTCVEIVTPVKVTIGDRDK